MKDFSEFNVGKGKISCKLVQTYLNQYTIQVFMNGICVHSQHVNNEEFEIIRKERD